MVEKYPHQDGEIPVWHQQADDHQLGKKETIGRIDLGSQGFIDFFDESAVHPNGEIVVAAVGRHAVAKAGFFINVFGATPQELFMALAPKKQYALPRLEEDHRERVAKDHSLPKKPRTFPKSLLSSYAGPRNVRTTFYEIYSNGPEDPFGCAYEHTFWNHWANYGNIAVEDNVDWPSGHAFIHNATQRALGLCYNCPDSTGTIDVWIESGIGNFFPIIWSDTFKPEHFVWFKTGTHRAKGISHLHWSNLSSGCVKLVGSWSDD